MQVECRTVRIPAQGFASIGCATIVATFTNRDVARCTIGKRIGIADPECEGRRASQISDAVVGIPANRPISVGDAKVVFRGVSNRYPVRYAGGIGVYVIKIGDKTVQISNRVIGILAQCFMPFAKCHRINVAPDSYHGSALGYAGGTGVTEAGIDQTMQIGNGGVICVPAKRIVAVSRVTSRTVAQH